MERGGYVYILTNHANAVLYVGVTSDLLKRIIEHRQKIYPNSFTAKYNCYKLVYFEMYSRIEEAIMEEKRIKAYNRISKIKLIESKNPLWEDLMVEIS